MGHGVSVDLKSLLLLKSISVCLAGFSCSFVPFPRGAQWKMEHARAGLPPLCGEVKGEGGLVLLSKAALGNECWGSSSGADLKRTAHAE